MRIRNPVPASHHPGNHPLALRLPPFLAHNLSFLHKLVAVAHRCRIPFQPLHNSLHNYGLRTGIWTWIYRGIRHLRPRVGCLTFGVQDLGVCGQVCPSA